MAQRQGHVRVRRSQPCPPRVLGSQCPGHEMGKVQCLSRHPRCFVTVATVKPHRVARKRAPPLCAPAPQPQAVQCLALTLHGKLEGGVQRWGLSPAGVTPKAGPGDPRGVEAEVRESGAEKTQVSRHGV